MSALGQALGNKGLLLLGEGKRSEAAAMFDAAAAEFRAVRRRAPLNADYRHLLAAALVSQGIGRHQQGKLAAAQRSLEEALSILDPLVKDNPDSRLYRMAQAQAQAALGNTLEEREQPEAALAWLEKARAGFLDVAGQRGDAQAREAAWIAWANLVRCHDRLARAADLDGDAQRALSHLGPLAQLRRERLEALSSMPAGWMRFGERVLAVRDLLETEEVRADLLDRVGDHRALAACVADMARLAPRWPGHMANLVHLARCAALAGKEGSPALARRYGKQALDLARPLATLPGFAGRLASPALDPLRALPGVGDEFRRLVTEGGG